MYDLTFSEMMAPYKHAMAVGIAAHGAEIVIKARIAKEHPLLLFNQLPKSAKAEDTLTVVELFEYGRTIQYNELPEALWASTGIRLSGVQQYQEFGRLRNATIHFAAGSDVDLHGEALRFLFGVMEPLVRTFWGESMVPYAAAWDDYVYEDDGLRSQLQQCGIQITPEIEAALGRRLSAEGAEAFCVKVEAKGARLTTLSSALPDGAKYLKNGAVIAVRLNTVPSNAFPVDVQGDPEQRARDGATG